MSPRIGNIKEAYYFNKRIGEGSFGTMYHAQCKTTEQNVAIKAIVKSSATNYQVFLNECQTMTKMDHPNIVRLQEVWEWKNIYFLVMDYCEGGDLQGYLEKSGRLEEWEAYKVVKQVVKTLIYLEINKIQHRDIKPDNLLLKNKNDLSFLKLVDFGLSRDFSSMESFKNTQGKSPAYMAPELSQKKGCYKSDVWSLGVILYKMISGKFPFVGKSCLEIFCVSLTKKPDFSCCP